MQTQGQSLLKCWHSNIFIPLKQYAIIRHTEVDLIYLDRSR